MKRICVFCGSKTGADPAYIAAAQALAHAMARRGIGLVYGGGNIGLMGVLADAMLAAGGEVVGVIPRFLMEKELAHTGATEMHLVGSMHERKARMADLAHAFIALPGGFGTADELFEILTWRQLHLHEKRIGLLNTCSFFDPLVAWIDTMIRDGFVKAANRELFVMRSTAEELLADLQD